MDPAIVVACKGLGQYHLGILEAHELVQPDVLFLEHSVERLYTRLLRCMLPDKLVQVLPRLCGLVELAAAYSLTGRSRLLQLLEA